MKKVRNTMKKMLCALSAAVFVVTACVEPVQAVSGDTTVHWRETEALCDRNTLSQPIQGIYTAESAVRFYPTNQYGFDDSYASAGETIYITNFAYICDGWPMYAASYRGRNVCFRRNQIDPKKIISVNRASYALNAKVKQTAVAGNVSEPNNWFLIYSKPDEKPTNAYGLLIPGDTVEILKKKYNSQWTQIKWKDRICYIKTKNINFKDAYLVGAKDAFRMEIKKAKQAKLTYKGILKDYDKDLTEKEFYKLADKWCKATGNKAFKPSKKAANKKLTQDKYNKLFQKLMKATKADKAVFEIGSCVAASPSYGVDRDEAIIKFYRSYVAYRALNKKKNELIVGGNYTISPASDKSLCLDLYEWSNEAKATIGLYENSCQDNQLFTLKINNGYYTMDNFASKLTLTGSNKGVYQEYKGFHSQKLTFEFNGDGTVCIKNGEGLYLDILDGTAKNGAALVYAPKSQSSSQKFVLKYHSYNRHGVS